MVSPDKRGIFALAPLASPKEKKSLFSIPISELRGVNWGEKMKKKGERERERDGQGKTGFLTILHKQIMGKNLGNRGARSTWTVFFDKKKMLRNLT